MTYEISWATGGRTAVEADSPEQAQAMARELIPRGGEWIDVDVLYITSG